MLHRSNLRQYITSETFLSYTQSEMQVNIFIPQDLYNLL